MIRKLRFINILTIRPSDELDAKEKQRFHGYLYTSDAPLRSDLLVVSLASARTAQRAVGADDFAMVINTFTALIALHP